MVPHSREDSAVVNSNVDGERRLAEPPRRTERVEPGSGCNISRNLLLKLRGKRLFLIHLLHPCLDLFLDLFRDLSLSIELATGLPIW